MKKFIFIYSLLLPNFIFAQSIPSNLSTIDTEYLESLPESVRADIEAEIEKNKTDETNTLKRRPSSELYKYETVMEWEQFQRQRNEELNKSERFGLNLFRSMQSSFMPINEPNFGNNYILDYGDIVEINLYGNTALSYELEVKRDGTISIPELGSTSVGGLNYQQGVDKIVSKIESSYTGTQVDVNLKEIRDTMPYTNLTKSVVDDKISKYEKEVEKFDEWADEQSQQDPLLVTGLDEKKEEDK